MGPTLAFSSRLIKRAEEEVNVCIVGGPAGFSATIRLKQLDKERSGVLEKGSEVAWGMLARIRLVWTLKKSDVSKVLFSPCTLSFPILYCSY